MRLKIRFICALALLMAYSFTAHPESPQGKQVPDSAYNRLLVKQALRIRTLDSIRRADSVSRATLQRQLQTLQEGDAKRRSLLNNLRQMQVTDSLLKAEKIARIDSLKNFVKGYPVAPFRDTLFFVYTRVGSFSPEERAEAMTNRILTLSKDLTFRPDSLLVSSSELSTDITYLDKGVLSVTENDALWMGLPPDTLATRYRNIIANAIVAYQKETNWKAILVKSGISLGILAGLFLLIWLLSWIFRRLRRRIEAEEGRRIRGFRIRDYELFNTRSQVRVLVILNRILKWFLILVLVYATFAVIFTLLPWTRSFARTLVSLVLDPALMILKATWNYIPNLIIIIVILVIFRYIMKGVRFLANEIGSGALRIPGFYPDWANPTYQIARILLLAFMLIVIFPYLPGSDSPVFKGVSVFLGVLFTFGSSGSLSNIVAGMILTYMRAFKVGDRVKIGDVTGDIIEKSLLVTRIRTIKNEIISIPNSTVMNSHTTNFSSEAPDKGLILHTSVTIGYDAPWRTVHDLLIQAALATDMLEKEPRPFVLQTSLDDFYVSYEINAYTKQPNQMANIYSELHKNIQDRFNEAGVEIMSPHYTSARDGNRIAIPDEYVPKDYKTPSFRVSKEE